MADLGAAEIAVGGPPSEVPRASSAKKPPKNPILDGPILSTLLKLAHAYEQAAKPRRAPRFLPTAQL